MAAAVMMPLQPAGFVSRYHVGEQRMQVSTRRLQLLLLQAARSPPPRPMIGTPLLICHAPFTAQLPLWGKARDRNTENPHAQQTSTPAHCICACWDSWRRTALPCAACGRQRPSARPMTWDAISTCRCLQELAKSPADVEVMGQKVIRVGFMTDQYREFFCNLNQVIQMTWSQRGCAACTAMVAEL